MSLVAAVQVGRPPPQTPCRTWIVLAWLPERRWVAVPWSDSCWGAGSPGAVLAQMCVELWCVHQAVIDRTRDDDISRIMGMKTMLESLRSESFE
jgi:hypothetical protein